MENNFKIYNSLTRKIEPIIPHEDGKIGMYTCGPTVYHFAHIGNLRSYIMEDVLEKSLRYVGYDVKRVMNITDVGHLSSDADTGEDKMLKGAQREHKTVMEVAKFYTDAFFADCEALNIKRPDVVEPATNCIDEFIHMIEGLLEKGYNREDTNKILNDFENNGKFQDFFDFIARMKTININNSIIDILIESNTLRDFGNMNTLINNKTKALSYASIASFKDTNTNEIMLDSKIKKPLLEVFPEDLELESKNEIKYLGMIFNAFVTSKFESQDKLINLKPGVEYKIALLVTKKKEITNTKFKSTSYFIEVCDSSGKEEIWFNSKYKHIFDEIKVNTIGYATIIKSTRNNKIYTNLYE